MKKFLPALLIGGCAALTGCASGSGGFQPATMGAAAAMDDATITARVKTVLLNDTQVSATQINVSTAAGIVTISGTVKTAAQEARAIELARTVSGVRDVKSALQVTPDS